MLPYNLFVKEFFKTIKFDKDTLKSCASAWRELSATEKLKYEKMCSKSDFDKKKMEYLRVSYPWYVVNPKVKQLP